MVIIKGEIAVSIRVRERDVESYLESALGKIGVPCYKFDPTNRNGMPDRIIPLPGERVLWVEMKTDNGRLSSIQKLRHLELNRLGHKVVVIWSREDVDELVGEIKRELE